MAVVAHLCWKHRFSELHLSLILHVSFMFNLLPTAAKLTAHHVFQVIIRAMLMQYKVCVVIKIKRVRDRGVFDVVFQ